MSDPVLDALPNSTPAARVVGRPWPKGISGNPAGRAKGSRHKLQDGFLTAVQKRWEQSGDEALRRCAEEEPATFVKMVASLMPKDLHVSASPLQAMTDDDLLAAVAAIKRYIDLIDAGSPPLVGETIDVNPLALSAP
jgi:hypothetical protein